MFGQGYDGTGICDGICDVAAEAGATQGAFTNHIRSLEAFAGAVLERYAAQVRGAVAQALDDRRLPKRDRPRRSLDLSTARLEGDDHARGCLISDLGRETPSRSGALRAQRVAIAEAWRAPFTACTAEVQAEGGLATGIAPAERAKFLLASWQGAIPRITFEHSPRPLARFNRIAFPTVFKEERP